MLVPLEPELVDLREFLEKQGMAREQLVDLAILVGTDFNQGVKGIGPKKALKLIRVHGRLENVPDEVKIKLLETMKRLGGCFLNQMCTETTGLAMANFKSKEHMIFYVKKEIFPRNVFEQRLR